MTAMIVPLHPRCLPRRGDLIGARLGYVTCTADVLQASVADGCLMVRPLDTAATGDRATWLIPPEAAICVLVPAYRRSPAPAQTRRPMTSHAALIDALTALRARVREARRHLQAAAARHPDDDDLAAAERLLRDPEEER